MQSLIRKSISSIASCRHVSNGMLHSTMNSQQPAAAATATITNSCQRNSISTSSQLLSKLDQFRDPTSREKRFSETVGRSWTVKELRRKSFDDLHKLWLVLYKEKNMLLTESELCRRNAEYFPQPERRQKLKKSMGAIRQVMGERKRDRISMFYMRREMEEKKHKEEEEQNETI